MTQGATNGTCTFHWDGGDLALVTLGSTVAQYDLEKLGLQVQNGSALSPLEVEDRDFSGTAIETHTGAGDSGANVTPNYYALNRLGSYGIPSVTGSYPPSGQAPQTLYGFPLVQMTRTDGYTLGGGALSFQGARVYDSGTQQWTTPDAYKGNVDDPSTQMAYEWNGNNPIANVDPSGYATHTKDCATNPTEAGCMPVIAHVLNKCGFDCMWNRNSAHLKVIAVVDAFLGIRPPDAITIQASATYYAGVHAQAALECNGRLYGGGGIQLALPNGVSGAATANWLFPWNQPGAGPPQRNAWQYCRGGQWEAWRKPARP